jgi:hypothetical protein
MRRKLDQRRNLAHAASAENAIRIGLSPRKMIHNLLTLHPMRNNIGISVLVSFLDKVHF